MLVIVDELRGCVKFNRAMQQRWRHVDDRIEPK